MALETSYPITSMSQSSLTDVSYRTPSNGLSRRVSRGSSVSPISSSPPPQHLDDDGERAGKEEKISVLDPRRFTPTLHANLVSEILSLRREVENKNGLVLDLEETLSSAKEENARLQDTLDERAKENRSLNQQMQMLEGGTLSALQELAQERDRMAESLADVKKRLDTSQKNAKSQEEDAERTNSLWERDRERWDSEKRNLDRKVHVVESRLKIVLAEVEAAQAGNHMIHDHHYRDRPISRTSGTRSASSRHRDSFNTNDGGEARNFRLSNIVELENTEGTTLADELRFDQEHSDEEGSEEGYASPEALPEELVHIPRSQSAMSHHTPAKARKVLGFGMEEDDDLGRDRPAPGSIARSRSQYGMKSLPARCYNDAGTQFSPPSSPTLSPRQLPEQNLQTNYDSNLGEQEIHRTKTREPEAEANVLLNRLDSRLDSHPETVTTVSSACQTSEQPLSPPETPVQTNLPDFANLRKPAEMASTATQTLDEDVLPMPSAASIRSETLEVPVIAIHPPSSGPQDRNSVVLPPQTKSVACQASIPTLSRSISVQTEEIRIDQRPVKLPPHLLPSAISSNPPSPTREAQQSKQVHSKDRPLSHDPPPPLNQKSLRRKPLKGKESQALNAAAESIGDRSTALEKGDGNVSDNSFATKEPIRKTLSKVQNSWKLVSQADKSQENLNNESNSRAAVADAHNDGKNGNVVDPAQAQSRFKNEGMAEKTASSVAGGKQADLRRPALISSGTAAHAQRPRSPSEPSTSNLDHQTINPPFPVPDRSSSRNIPWSARDEAASPTPNPVSYSGPGQSRKEHGRPPVKRQGLRKIRSATSTNYDQPRARSRSPPPSSIVSSSFVDSPVLEHPPPLPHDEIKSPRQQSFRGKYGSDHKKSNPSADGSSTSEQTTVVDAIAQTMIGEWMWKYVRRRKSFGLPESASAEFESGKNSDTSSGGGLRHQRWVWIAPYERAIMWSSKQPVSGSALMGKSGRKLAIQSVLDVRDDTAMPKGAAPSSCFGRSILILTPQRALKFTATSRERHYVWLTALSFLSHSNVIPSELSNPPPAPQEAPPPPPSRSGRRGSTPQTASLRRHPIRDSIRIAKGKDRAPTSDGGRRAFTSPSNHAIQEHYGSAFDEEKDAAEPPLVPRTTAETRKRSNTGPKSGRPSSSFRTSSSSAKPSTYSVGSRVESENSHGWTTDGGQSSRYGNQGRRGSEWEPANQTAPANLFEAVGTVRMEAFVKNAHGEGTKGKTSNVHAAPFGRGGHEYDMPGTDDKRERGSYRTRTGRKKDMRYWGAVTEKAPVVTSPVKGGDFFEGF